MKPDDALITARRRLLSVEVQQHGQANIARKTGKADRQIGDLVAGRASFGDRIARELEPLLRPDLPAGWMVFALTASKDAPASSELKVEEPPQNDYQEGLIDAKARVLTQQAAEIAALWIELSPERRTELRDQLRTELGKSGDEAAAKFLSGRRRVNNQGTGTR